ncbi:phage tail protein [Serratia nevei]|uniref:phage tail-collar fiber domain-containing protein n=1 Tax=Serratia nevei TaxID=2703794 RepID=UPI00254387D8|nr:phage tail protein [Serratia nevei]WIJ64021.1 phage tail protein [Serratia nevei]
MNKYKAIITTAGAAKIAAASAGGTQLKIVSMAVGDGNGTLPTPNPAQTKLVNEKYRAALNGLTIDKALKNHILAEMIIPANVGGWWLREMGLYDEAGTLIAVSNMAESYKPKLEEGSGRTQTLRMILIVSSTEAIQVIAGGDTVLATKDFVADAIAAHEKTRNHPDASTTAKGLVQLSSATTSTDETKASTPKALKAVNDASMKKAANLSDLTDKAAARGNLALGTAATKNVGLEGGQLMEVGAFGLGSGSRHREDAYCNQAEIYRVNSSSKNTPGGDVYGVLSLPCDGGPSGAYMAVQNNGNAFFGRSNIPSNGVVWFQAYTTKFKPTAADVGAWSKTESDGRFVKQSGDTMSGPLALPRVVFPNENTANADDDLNRENGFTVESLVATANKGYPVPGGMGVLFTGKVNEFRNVQFAVGSGDLAFYLRSMRKDSAASLRWARVYTTDYKPTAADVGALTDAQAAQKYALRSIKVNGKPLSADVNLLAGDVNAWNKTEADGRYLAKTGGNITGPLSSTSWLSATSVMAKYHNTPSGGAPEGSGAYSAQLDSKAPFYQENFDWDVNSGGHYVPLVKGRCNRKGQGYPTAVSFGYLLENTPSFAMPVIHAKGDNGEAIWRFDPNSKQFYSPGNVLAGQAILHTDGNITGTIWGGYLSNWLNQNFNGRVDWGTYNRDVGARATIDYVNSRSAVAGGRNAWWHKDEVTGFIIQGGVVNRTDYATRVNFPRGYTRECFGVQLTLAGTNGNWFGDSRVNIQARDLDNNGFNAMMDGQEQVVLWQSVGV